MWNTVKIIRLKKTNLRKKIQDYEKKIGNFEMKKSKFEIETKICDRSQTDYVL